MNRDLWAPVLNIRIAGIPVPQGSMSGFPRGKHVIITDQKGKTLKPWREAIRSEVSAALGEHWTPMDGPVAICLDFAIPKPASAPKRKRTWPIKTRSTDIDKLARSVLDALTQAGLWVDDCRCVRLDVSKNYAGDGLMSVPGVSIEAYRLQQLPEGTST